MVNNDINLIRGNNAFANKKYDLAQEYYIKDLELNPKSARSLNNLAITYIKGSAKNISTTLKYFQQLINHPEIHFYVNKELIKNLNEFGMVDELNSLKDTITSEILLSQIWFFIEAEEAVKHIELVSEKDKNSDYHFLYAQISFSLQNYPQAIMQLNTAIKMGSMNSKLFYLKSQSLLRLRDISEYKKANKSYQIILSFEKNNTPVIEQLEAMRTLMENNSELRTVAEYKYQMLTLLLSNNHNNDSLTLFNELDVSKISSKYRQIIIPAALKSRNFKVVNSLFESSNIETMGASEAVLYCQSYKRIVDQDLISSFCKKASVNFKDSAVIHFWYGILLLHKNKLEEAIKEILISIDFAPWMDQWRIQLAQIYLSIGRTENASKVIDESISENRIIIEQFKRKNGLLNSKI